jgi:uncharacterized membrane protein YdfJ with MMPL/SSD domain
MATSQVSFMKMLGAGLTLAILVDTTLIRAVLMPAAMRLMGSANWWAPAATCSAPHGVRHRPRLAPPIAMRFPPSKFMSATAASTSPRIVRSFMIARMEMRLRPVPRNISY